MIPFFAMLWMTIVAAAIIAAALYWRFKNRELQHRERLIALEKGVELPTLGASAAPPWTPRVYLLRGMIWLFTGIAICASVPFIAIGTERHTEAWIRVGEANRAKANGASDEQVKEIMMDRGSRGMPPGIGLIGLIPMGVGLAYLITYRAERARAGSL